MYSLPPTPDSRSSSSYHVSNDSEWINEWIYHDNHDQICLICNEWCLNDDDFLTNFRTCPICPQSFHRRCIPIIYRYIFLIEDYYFC